MIDMAIHRHLRPTAIETVRGTPTHTATKWAESRSGRINGFGFNPQFSKLLRRQPMHPHLDWDSASCFCGAGLAWQGARQAILKISRLQRGSFRRKVHIQLVWVAFGTRIVEDGPQVSHCAPHYMPLTSWRNIAHARPGSDSGHDAVSGKYFFRLQ